jgi:hypothetical protein
MTVSSTLIFGKEEMVDAAAIRAASLGANTVKPLALSNTVTNVMLPALFEELAEDETDNPDRIVLSIVKFWFVSTVEIGPGGSRTALIM